MKSAKVPPAPFFNSRKRLRQAVVADPNENFQDEDDSWLETFAGGRSDLMNNNERDRFSDQCKTFPQSISYNGNRNLYQTGQQPSSFQSIDKTATSYSKPSIERNIPGSKISGPVKRGQYHIQQNNNNNNVGVMSRKSMERAAAAAPPPPQPPPVTPPTSNMRYSPRQPTTDSSSARSTYNWSFSAQSCKSVSSPQMFGGESFIQEANVAEVAPAFNNRPSNEPKHSPSYSQTNTSSKVNVSGVATTANKKERPTEKALSPINPIFTTFIKELKNNYSKYKEKFHIICEVYGVLDSAVLPDRNLSGRQFLLRDNSDSIECVFYEIDRMLPRLTRGHWLRCVGMIDNKTKRLHCISIRPATVEERNLPRIMAFLQQNYLNGFDDNSG
ncbi:spermatogenesis-associated protein 22-like [Octopus sinensis]|uniref:Spermatogenesis-associated protein 22-like n=1 Tax=Octopus sinensis TaxID=2607531 RepID=A0A7E6FNK0_9MOLL|nr:spermatogenesis-associated protein 22-like [Octopus sinensis]